MTLSRLHHAYQHRTFYNIIPQHTNIKISQDCVYTVCVVCKCMPRTSRRYTRFYSAQLKNEDAHLVVVVTMLLK